MFESDDDSGRDIHIQLRHVTGTTGHQATRAERQEKAVAHVQEGGVGAKISEVGHGDGVQVISIKDETKDRRIQDMDPQDPPRGQHRVRG